MRLPCKWPASHQRVRAGRHATSGNVRVAEPRRTRQVEAVVGALGSWHPDEQAHPLRAPLGPGRQLLARLPEDVGPRGDAGEGGAGKKGRRTSLRLKRRPKSEENIGWPPVLRGDGVAPWRTASTSAAMGPPKNNSRQTLALTRNAGSRARCCLLHPAPRPHPPTQAHHRNGSTARRRRG